VHGDPFASSTSSSLGSEEIISKCGLCFEGGIYLTLTAQAKVDLVTNVDAKAAFQVRVDAQKAKVEEAKAKLGEAAIEAAAETAVAAYEAAPLTSLDEVSAAEALGTDAQAKVDLVKDADKKAAFQARVDAQKTKVAAAKDTLAPVKVSSVTSITKQGVTVSFPALTEAIEEATVEVKNNGTVVPVKAKLLDAGETTATFEFVTPLTAEPAGTWTVDGVSFDANAQAAVIAVNTAAGANGNQVKLLAALKSSYFNGVVDANIADYQVEMAGKTYVSVEEVQKAIDKVNKAKAGDAAADAVTKAKNEVELLAALQNGGFARVNADLISKYATYEEVPADPAAPDYKTANTATKVQAIIDAVNLIAAQDAVTAADTTADTALSADAISKAQALVSVLPTETDGDKAVKKSLQDRLDKANAVAKVKGATTQASLLSALKSPVLKLQKIDDTLAKYYKEKLVPADITSVSYNIQTNIIDAGKTAAIADYGKKISEVTEETSTADLKALLTELKRLDSTNFTADIVDGLLGKYRDALVAVKDKTSKDQPGEISGIVAAQNSPDTAIDAVNETAADDDADALLAA
ncbi:hypothetical protein D478_25553, partial [Brevibacillus agri BAB-2500]